MEPADSARETVVLGIVGSVLDAGHGRKRHLRWRPTVDIARHAELGLKRLELLVSAEAEATAEQVAADVRALAPGVEVRLHPLRWGDPWDFEAVYGVLHDFARAYTFRADERYLVHVTTGTHVAQICLFLLCEARYLPAKLLQTAPPTGEDKGAVGRLAMVDLDLSRYDRLAQRFDRERRDARTHLKAGIETQNPRFNRLIERIEQVAIASPAPLLILGPTGAGKSWLARRIYDLRRGRNLLAGEFVEVNCATLRGDTAMSTLFGHARGAYTGAAEARQGLLRRADGGLLFLDEIGELGPDEQAMLLRAIEEKTFQPVGSDREAKSDFQLIAGTNRDLRAEARRGRFRDDLLARIDLWTFTLPGLKDRPEDVAPNLDFELARQSRLLRRNVSMNDRARAAFLSFATSPEAAWRGNFRDFGAAVTRMATLAQSGRITPDEVAEEIDRLREAWCDPDAPAPPATQLPSPAEAAEAADSALLEGCLGEAAAAEIDRFDRVQLALAIRVCQGAPTLSEAGRRLFDRSRERRASVNDADRLRKYLARYGLTFEGLRGG